jgi:hypothetical protein
VWLLAAPVGRRRTARQESTGRSPALRLAEPVDEDRRDTAT